MHRHPNVTAGQRRPLSRWLASGHLLLAIFLGARAADTAPPPDQVAAIHSEYIVQQWQTDDGLPQNSVTAIAQTPDGYLWCGTFQGMARFDGRKFVVFNSENTPELPSNRIVLLYSDRQGGLWIKSEYGDLTRLRDGRFTVFPAGANGLTTMASGLPPGGVEILGEDAAGRFWVRGARNGEPACYQLVNDTFEFAPAVRVVRGDLKVPAVLGREASFWDGRGNPVFWLEQGEDTTPRSGAPRLGFVTGRPLPGSGKGIWARSEAGLARWEGDQWERITPHSPRPPDGGTLWEDRRGQVWSSGAGTPLSLLGEAGPARVLSLIQPAQKDGVRAVYEDREGNVWVGLEGSGLCRLKPRTFKSFGVDDGLVSPLAKAVTEDAAGRVWVVTGSQAGYLAEGRPPFVNPPAAAIPNAWTALAGQHGVLWLGSYGAGLYRHESGRQTRLSYAGDQRDWVAKAILEDRQGVIWAGGLGGLFRVEGDRLHRSEPVIARELLDVCALADDRAGRLYAGLTRGGLLRLSGGEWTRFTRADGLPSDGVRSLFVDSRDALWIGASNGKLGRLKHGVFFTFSAAPLNLPGDIMSILEDDEDRLWLGTSRGVYLVARHELDAMAEGRRATIETVHFTRAEGLAATECAGGFQPASWKARDGRLWFSTINGVSVVDPKRMPLNSVPPPVLIEELLVDGRVVAAGGGGSALILPPGNRRLEIHYTALSFTAPDKVRFKYRLGGLDKDWNEAGTRREAYFQGLPPGPYQFRVLACNNDGVWNEAGATLALVVRPFYWQTWWFRAGVLFALAVSLAGLVRFVALRKVRRRVELLERQLAVDRERSRIASDLHDDLGSSLTRISLLGEITETQLGDPNAARDSVRKMTETSREVVRAMDEILWALNPKNDTLENLVTFISQFAREHLALAGIQCRFDLPMSMPPRVLDSQLRHNLLLTVKEALNNVVKHAAATEVQIAVAFEGNLLILVIADNGRGFAPGASTADGDGLINLPRRVQSLGGDCVITSEPGQGTRVRVELLLPPVAD